MSSLVVVKLDLGLDNVGKIKIKRLFSNSIVQIFWKLLINIWANIYFLHFLLQRENLPIGA